MTEFSQELIDRSGYEREGFAAHYDRYRPRPPAALLETLLQFARIERPSLVVDLGSGTGLSARAWSGVAEKVVGVEPNPAMRDEAEAATREPNVEHRLAFAQETGLPDGCADIVTCSQSLHWMEPEPTFTEAARILRPHGVFAAYDYDVNPVVDRELDEAYDAYLARRGALRRTHGHRMGADSWSKETHLERMRASGRFRFCRELLLQSVEHGDAERVVGLARSIGMFQVPLAEDEVERKLRHDELEATARRVLGDRTVPFRFGYRVRVGVR